MRAGNLSDITQQTMSEVVKIARAISVVQPRLDEAKYIEYALGIYRASRRYEIDSDVLIAIAQQETGFRENLPEGAAGEIGICQIRKQWLKSKLFRDEFDRPTLKDLKHPAKNFMMAALILRDLKQSVTSKTLPYWSYYNARKFENRFKYFLLVNRNIAALRRYAAANGGGVRTAASEDKAPTPAPRVERSSPPADSLAGAKTIVAPEGRSALTAPLARNVEPREPASRRGESPSSLAEVSRNTYWAPDLRNVRNAVRSGDGDLERSIAD